MNYAEIFIILKENSKKIIQQFREIHFWQFSQQNWFLTGF